MSVKKYFSLVALLYLICGCAQYAASQSPQNVVWTTLIEGDELMETCSPFTTETVGRETAVNSYSLRSNLSGAG